MNKKNVIFYNIHDLLKIIDKDIDKRKLNDDFFIVDEKFNTNEKYYEYSFRTDNAAILLVVEGVFEIQINLETIYAKKNDILILTPNSTVHPYKVDNPAKTIGIVFNEYFFQKNIRHMHHINEIILSSEINTQILKPNTQERESFRFLINKITDAGENKNYYSKDIIYHYFNALLLELMAIYRSSDTKIINSKTFRKKQFIHQFLTLLSENSKKERTVEFYADRLSVTPSYLSRIVKETSGESTRDIITNFVIMEACSLLMNSQLSITQISEELQFSDPSFFGKFFKRKMKMSPKIFRMKNI
ncbi:helix-turn-helix domain-containing protein [Elizabethkingia ursingii]|uniref:AraC family transcriptional regulator n=1 Tax=Elizabethkingia ursingii TaxID=1756150 RepID=UPI0020114665|nr:helix-turn-helix domain-containing protein [Elizabethkingia ursingii]MCL1668169.1 helix-turn-helix domain-containing protein [Elizabethkingia ursingii]